MKLSQLIETLLRAQSEYGDVPVMLLDQENGEWSAIVQVGRLHPYTAKYGCLDRDKPVNGIALYQTDGNSPDLILARSGTT